MRDSTHHDESLLGTEPGRVSADAENWDVTVIVDGAWRQSLSVVRSLGRAGYRVMVVQTSTSQYLEKSRYVDRALPLASDLGHGAARVQELVAQLGDQVGEVVYYPIGDIEIRFALDQQASFPEDWYLAMVSPEVVARCADKTGMVQCTEAAGVPGIRTVPVTSLAELKAAAESIGFPCLVKGNNEAIRHRSRKAFILRGPGEIDRTFAGWAGGEQTMLVQTYCVGPRYNVYFVALEGALLATGGLRAIRTDMLDGTGLAVEGVTVEITPELRQHTASLVRELGYHGVGCAQFLMNHHGEDPVFLEINARLGANFGAVYRAGLDLPRFAVELALGRDIASSPVAADGVTAGRRYSWFYGDVWGCARAVVRLQTNPMRGGLWLLNALEALVRADDHITWDRDDPWPTVEIWKQRLLPWRRSATL